MKIVGTLVALCALNGASAFAPKASSNAQSSALFSSISRADTARGPGTATRGPAPGRQAPAGPVTNVRRGPSGMMRAREILDNAALETVQGGSLRTWSFASATVERVQVLARTEGRPLNAMVELWQGPDNSPQRMGVYIEDGSVRPFNAIIYTPRGSNAIAIRNTNPLEFPLSAYVQADNASKDLTRALYEKRGRTVQGGAVYTEPFAPAVETVTVVLKTDGRPLNARIELLQGPNNNKQVVELYTEDGLERPFIAVIDTPGTGNVVRIVNTATVEFPLTASIEPDVVEPGYQPGPPGMQSVNDQRRAW